MIADLIEQLSIAILERAWDEGTKRPFALIAVSPTVHVIDRAAVALALGAIRLCPSCNTILTPSLGGGWKHGGPAPTVAGVQ